MFLLAILAVFGNFGQLQSKYDYCKSIDFKEVKYCEVQKYLYDHKKEPTVKAYDFYNLHK